MEAEVSTGGLGTAAAIAAFLVPFVSMVKRPAWSRQAKYALGMAAAFIAAVVGAVVDGGFTDVQSFIVTLSVAMAASTSIYNLYFEDTLMNAKLEQFGNNVVEN